VKSPLKSKRGEYPEYEGLLVTLFIGMGLKTKLKTGCELPPLKGETSVAIFGLFVANRYRNSRTIHDPGPRFQICIDLATFRNI
jgi:hypothetical protein